jgi:hypothetical protein
MKGGTAGRYNRAEYLAKRRLLMNDWNAFVTGA